METLTTLSVINLLPRKRDEIDLFVHKTVQSVKDGDVNALELKSQLKAFEKAIEEIDKATKDEQLTERMKYREKVIDLYGCKIELAEVGTKYDYSACGDPYWNDLDKMIKSLSEQKKQRETFLKNISKPIGITDESTGGETVVINPPVKSSTTGLKFSI